MPLLNCSVQCSRKSCFVWPNSSLTALQLALWLLANAFCLLVCCIVPIEQDMLGNSYCGKQVHSLLGAGCVSVRWCGKCCLLNSCVAAVLVQCFISACLSLGGAAMHDLCVCFTVPFCTCHKINLCMCHAG